MGGHEDKGFYPFCTFSHGGVIRLFSSLSLPSTFKKRFLVEKLDTIPDKMSQGSRGRLVCSLCNMGLSWTPRTFCSLTFWLIITICVIAGSHTLQGLPIELLGQPQGCTSCRQLLRPLQVFFRNKNPGPLTATRSSGEWLAFLPASSPLAVGRLEPKVISWSPVSSSSMPVVCLHA